MRHPSDISAKFITFEGGEGAGKTTQIHILKTALEKAGIAAVTTREPGGSPGAEEIRKLLVEGEPDRWQPMTEALLNIAARSDHVKRFIRPQMDAGKWVVSDRFFDSTLAYQGYGHGLELSRLEQLHEIVFADFYPDLTLIFDVPVEIGLARTGIRGGVEDRFEKMDISFHERLRRGFLDIAKRQPDRCYVIDATQSVDAVEESVKSALLQKLDIKLS